MKMDENEATRTPPHDRKIEHAVLMSIMAQEQDAGKWLSRLEEGDFYDSRNRKIFLLIQKSWEQFRSCDHDIVLSVIEQKSDSATAEQKYAEFGGFDAFVPEPHEILTPWSLEARIKALKRLRAARIALTLSMGAYMDACEKSPEEAAETLELAYKRIRDALSADEENIDTRLGSDISKVVSEMERLQKKGDGITDISFGLKDLDYQTAGIEFGRYIIIGARTSGGKTSLALRIMESVAIDQRVPVFYASTEIPRLQIQKQMLAGMAKVDLMSIQKGIMTKDDWANIIYHVSRLEYAPIYVADNMRRWADVETKIRQHIDERECKLIIVDYIQHLSSGRGQTKEEDIASISTDLAGLAREKKVAVIVLSQLNRMIEQRTEGRPKVSDLRNSGQLEQDADVILLIDRKPGDTGEADIIIGKNRCGPAGITVKLAFLPHCARFEDLVYNAADIVKGMN